MQLTDYIGIAGLYTRLSRDDGTDSEDCYSLPLYRGY